jgi:hypothetical protein
VHTKAPGSKGEVAETSQFIVSDEDADKLEGKDKDKE